MNHETDTTAHSAWVQADAELTAKGRSFHWARHLLGETHAARATRLYGFCRYLDDLADEAASTQSARENLAAASRAIVSGKSTDPVLSDGLRLMAECQIAPSIVLELIQGLVSDLDLVRIPDEAALLRYAYRVAGTVGVMMCGVLDVHRPEAYSHAIDLGIAMQLTNICRDISEDAALGRRYLPACMIGEVDPEKLVLPAEGFHLALSDCVTSLLDKADRYYASGEAGLSYLPFRARCGILVAARVYREIGCKLRARGCNFWLARMMVSDREKAVLTAQALLIAPARKSFWKQPHTHDASLHLALRGLPCIQANPC